MNSVLATCKKEILDIYRHALDSVKPERLVRQSLTFSDRKLIIKNPLDAGSQPFTYNLEKSRIHVIGGGKCVLSMAKGLAGLALESGSSHLFSQGHLSLPITQSVELDSETKDLLRSVGVTCEFGSKNNLPDEDSVKITNRILDCANEASKCDKAEGLRPLFIVLLSGGGSACLSSPKHVSLEQKLTIINDLVKKGACIEDLNTVRRCLSNVKGGRLARHIRKCNSNSEILSLIISDVVGDPLEFIASGPTCVGGGTDNLSYASVCERYNLPASLIPQDVESVLDDVDGALVRHVIIGNSKLALEAITTRALAMDYEVLMLGDGVTGKTDDILNLILEHAAKNPPKHGKQLILCGGESTVVLGEGQSWGVGGRVQEMALDYTLTDASGSSGRLYASNYQDLFFAGSTDGQDGPTDVAGCFASKSELSQTKCINMSDAHKAKTCHDSNTFWSLNKPDWLVRTGPTGTNVMDVYLLVRVANDWHDH